MRVLVIDVGGTNVKVSHSDHKKTRRFPSGSKLTPERLVQEVKRLSGDWQYDVITLGLPVPIKQGKAAIEPKYLGAGWKNFDFSQSFEQPLKVINDAALQALGSYRGGRMLFLGLGTGLGSTLIVEHAVIPLELGQLRCSTTKCLEEVVSDTALENLGQEHWREAVTDMIELLSAVFMTDYIVVGGGNAKKLGKLPRGVQRGDNRDALEGGIRLWEEAPEVSDAGLHVWRVT